jgi:hypothetical protein
MQDSWEGFLDIIGLKQDNRQKAKLTVLLDLPLGVPKKGLILNLLDYITKLYESEKCTILWWYEANSPTHKLTSKPYTKIINKGDLIFLQLLWERIAGDYILFLPEKFDLKIDVQDEEEFIGQCLIHYSQLFLKTPDANEVLYLSLNE